MTQFLWVIIPHAREGDAKAGIQGIEDDSRYPRPPRSRGDDILPIVIARLKGPDPKAYCAMPDRVIHAYRVHGDGERGSGQRNTVGYLGGSAADTRAV